MIKLLRGWQENAANQCVAVARSGADRALIYACPGSGKTIAGLYTAASLSRRAKVSDKIVVITPSIQIRSQWIAEAEDLGMRLEILTEPAKLRQSTLPFGIDGYIVSYQSAINWKRSLRTFCDTAKPIVILDEVHHTAGADKDRDGNAWGEAVEYAFHSASFKVCTTGTPFRQGKNPIAFVNYNEKGEATPTTMYPYSQAIRDGICRPIEFSMSDSPGGIAWTSLSNGNSHTADFSEQLSKKLSHERLAAALSTDGQFPFKMLSEANLKLEEIRKGKSNADKIAAGLIVAISKDHANQIAAVLEDISGSRPLVVHNTIDDAQEIINSFKDGTSPWIVGINMLSEGVNIKRLRVGVYASRIRTPLYVHQFCGRVTRVLDDPSERSFIFMPNDPDLREIALEIEQEKYHALGEEEPLLSRGLGSGLGIRRKSGVVTEYSDGMVVALVFGGLRFPMQFINEHRARAEDAKRNNSSCHAMGTCEILKLMIEWGVIAPPKEDDLREVA